MTRIEHKFRLCENYLAARPLAALAELSELQKILRSFVAKENLLRYLVQQKNYKGRVLKVTGDGSALTLLEETDIKPDFTVWKKFMRYFSGVEHYWFANGDVWRTNDRDGIFFPDRYAAAATYGFEDGICEKTFQSTDDLLFFFSEFFGERMVSVPALMLRIRAYNETRRDNYVSLMEMQISDDPVLNPVVKERKL